MRIVVLGAGAWGTALAMALSSRHAVSLWARDPVHCGEMASERVNRRHLDRMPFPPDLIVEPDFSAALAGADLAIVAVPVSGLRATIRRLAEDGAGVPLVWVSKGFEAGTSRLPHQVATEEYGRIAPVGVLSGPSFAHEVAQGLPVALTLASADAEFASRIAAALTGPRMRIYSSEDVVGVEVGGAVKNVMAIAAGISDGLGLGNNARAALITRGLAEITRLGLRLGGHLETFLGLSGVGDLTLTCAGDLSRNRTVGLMLAAGKPLEEILAGLGATAEGVYTAKEVDRLAARLGIPMPITRAVCGVLHEGISPREAVEELMRRDPRPEGETISPPSRAST